MLKKPKKVNVAQLKKKTDVVWSTYVRMRDADKNGNVTCISCTKTGHWKTFQCGHFVSRRCNFLRFNELNTNAQCVACNMFQQGNQYAYARGLDGKYGKGTAENLYGERFRTHKSTISELENIMSYAKEYIALNS